MEKRTCSRCRISKPIAEFATRPTHISGFQAYCNDCTREYRKQYYLDNKPYLKKKAAKHKRTQRDILRAFVSKYLSNRVCEHCGYENSVALEFHHPRPEEKEFAVANGVSNGISIKKLLGEMKKCVILCSNCHAIVTRAQWDAAKVK